LGVDDYLDIRADFIGAAISGRAQNCILVYWFLITFGGWVCVGCLDFVKKVKAVLQQ